MSTAASSSATSARVADQRIPATPDHELDAVLAQLRERAPAWAALDLDGRLALLDELVQTTRAAASAWTDRAARAKGLDPAEPLAGEELLSGPLQVVRHLVLLRGTLRRVRDGELPVEFATGSGGRVTAATFPVTLVDRVLFPGFRADTWLLPDVTLQQARSSTARLYRGGAAAEGGVAVVLGAGNVSSIAPTDALYQLLAHNRVVALKMNPVNEQLGPFLAEALHPLIRDGYLQIVYGGAQQGAHLAHHDQVDALHMTGSDATHDAIVFGTGEQGRQRKADTAPQVDAEVTSELGNVTPVIVVPGPWSDADVAFQGENLASMLTNNAGFNCIATRVIVQHAAWSRRHDLLEAVRTWLGRAPERAAYYPGAVERWQRFTESHDRTECFGRLGDDVTPFALLAGLDAGSDHLAFTTEAFASVMGEVALDAPRSVPAYLRQAVAFANDRLWGNLGATLLVHPKSLKDPDTAAAVEWAVEHLRYGTVVVNHWSGAAGYALVSTPWGAYPGNPLDDIQSGRGWVHNTFLLDDSQIDKTVVRGPFRTPVKPPWFLSYGRLRELGERLLELEATGDLRHLPGVMWSLVRG